jgi:hypothetical protein
MIAGKNQIRFVPARPVKIREPGLALGSVWSGLTSQIAITQFQKSLYGDISGLWTYTKKVTVSWFSG